MTDSLLVEMQSSPVALEDNWAVSYEMKHNLTLRSSNHTAWNLLKCAEKLSPRTKTCTGMFMAASFMMAKS